MTSSGLLELAERCEKATGPDRLLDTQISDALRRHGVKRPPGMPRALTASIDAALTLVPDGYVWHVDLSAGGYYADVIDPVSAAPGSPNGAPPTITSAALALCAAALYAHAAMEKPDDK